MICFTKCFCGYSVIDKCNNTTVLFCYNEVARISHHSGSRDQIPATITFLLPSEEMTMQEKKILEHSTGKGS